MKPGDKIEFAYLRNGDEKTADATLASQNGEKVAAASQNQETLRPSSALNSRRHRKSPAAAIGASLSWQSTPMAPRRKRASRLAT